jgi:histidyl-tRNA synthetase
MFSHLPGFRDFPPEECAFRNFLFGVWRRTARSYGFAEFDTPVLESLDLYRAKSGPEIVEQLFHFVDKGEREVALRPEMTPGLARMVAARASSLKKPVKWFSIGENFRYERMQKGRLRAFYQWNADLLGENDPRADAEVIGLALQCLENLGLNESDIVARISDRHLWFLFLEALGLEGDRLQTVLGVIDKWERMSPEAIEEALRKVFGDQTAGFQSKVNRLLGIRDLDTLEAFFQENLTTSDSTEKLQTRIAEWRLLWGSLEAAGWKEWIRIDFSIVRGLAYYTGFVFEVFERSGKSRALAGGGRYDHLVEKLGGPSMPAIGFGMGDVTVGDLLREKGLVPQWVQSPDIYLVYGAEQDIPKIQRMARELRRLQFAVEFVLKPVGFKKQFNQATGSGAALAVILGEEESQAGQVTLRDLRGRQEKRIPAERLIQAVQYYFAEGELVSE